MGLRLWFPLSPEMYSFTFFPVTGFSFPYWWTEFWVVKVLTPIRVLTLPCFHPLEAKLWVLELTGFWVHSISTWPSDVEITDFVRLFYTGIRDMISMFCSWSLNRLSSEWNLLTFLGTTTWAYCKVYSVNEVIIWVFRTVICLKDPISPIDDRFHLTEGG